MITLLALAIFFIISLGPSLYVNRVMRKYAYTLDYAPGTGGQLSRHLLDRFLLHHVKVIEDDNTDFYDPTKSEIHLQAHNYQAKTLTAITIATHECAHAIQHQQHSRLFMLRGTIVKCMQVINPIASACAIASGIMLAIHPKFGILGIAIVLCVRCGELVLHLVTLPIELDASFNKALPILQKGKYLQPQDIPKAKKILTAAALTYVSSTLANILLIWRSFVFRR